MNSSSIVRATALVSLLMTAACSGADAPAARASEADLQQDSATIVFRADGSLSAPVSLVEGQTLIVQYPRAGRSVCPESQGGMIEGGASIDGGHASPFFFHGFTSDDLFETARITVPHGQHVALWFARRTAQATSHFPAGAITCWDSKGGQNFVFPITPSTRSLSTISFGADFSVHQSGALVAGSQAWIRYARARNSCRGTLEVNMQAEGGNAIQLTNETTDLTDDGVAAFAFTVPDAGHVAFWFLGTGQGTEGNSGCVQWDSNSGRNFNFAIAGHP